MRACCSMITWFQRGVEDDTIFSSRMSSSHSHLSVVIVVRVIGRSLMIFYRQQRVWRHFHFRLFAHAISMTRNLVWWPDDITHKQNVITVSCLDGWSCFPGNKDKITYIFHSNHVFDTLLKWTLAYFHRSFVFLFLRRFQWNFHTILV